MEIYPLLEVRAGKSIYRTAAKADQPHLLTDDPNRIVRRWHDEGADRIHIHDVDGARMGLPQNRDLVREIVRRYGIKVQYSGGVRDGDVVTRVLSFGVERAVLSAEAVKNSNFAGILQEHGEKIFIEVVSCNGVVPPVYSLDNDGASILDVAKRLEKLGAGGIYSIDLRPDGTVNGLDSPGLAQLLSLTPIPVCVQRELTSAGDVRSLNMSGADAAVVGKIVFDGTTSVPQLLQLAV